MVRTDEISNTQDVIDSRDVIARIEELEADGALASAEDPSDEDAELRALHDLTAEAEGYAPDWRDGATLIRDSYFERYAEELADDCGLVPAGLAWPCNCIDWEKAARELQMDYTCVSFDGVDYWVR